MADDSRRRRARVGILLLGAFFATEAVSEGVNAAQRRAATEFLAAAAATETQALAFAVHPLELERLRTWVLQSLRQEAARGESGARHRLFGEATPLAEIERMTSIDLFRAIARRESWARRAYADIAGVAAVSDVERVHLLVQGISSEDRVSTRVIELVTVLPYGKEWKAALPDSWRADIEDQLSGRIAQTTRSTPVAPTAGAPTPSAPTAPARNPPAILAMLEAAEKTLVEGRCDRYYREYLSPELRASLSGRTVDALIKGCERGIAQRELLIAALRIVRRSSPRFEADGDRAIYDVSDQGLPYDQYVLARLEGRWYIAE